ncbi:MAG TPA: MoaD/ThiS family protein [Gemmatimonadales bacterium]|nr:MoaD/ThiS family protein [Gemmatimonadales bacterium]
MPTESLHVRCRFFARYAELLGTEEVALTLPGRSIVRDAVRRVRQELPHGERIPERPLVAVNREHALADRPLANGDELAFLPPLAGG